jgi:hypothetical protein
MKFVLLTALAALMGVGFFAMQVLAQRPTQPDVLGQSVVGIQGVPVVATHPMGTQALSYSSPLGAYVPGAPINAATWPTSCSSPIVQPTGTVYSDSGTLKVCP